MNWSEPLTERAFERWLVAVAGGKQIRQGKRLDPFATSMRLFTPTSDWLTTVEGGGALPARGGGSQIQTDLRGAGLLEEGPAETLSDLGRECLTGWRAAGVANDERAGELVRCAIAVIAGVKLGVPTYLEMLRFWKELRSRYPVDSLLSAPEWLYLASYLNQDRDGYSPWRAVLAQEHDPVISLDADWAGLMTHLTDPDATIAADNLRKRVEDFATRPAGRLFFCMAMELYASAELADFDQVSAYLANWGMPRA